MEGKRMLQTTRTRISADEYYAAPAYAQHDLIQLIDGEIVTAMPPVPLHQRIVREIFYFLITFSKNKGGEALASPIEVFLDEYNIFEPDVLYLKPGSACTIGEQRLTGAPDLVVEVLSPGTAKYDRQQKFCAYEAHDVAEYWIVDPAHGVIEVWTRVGGQFRLHGAYAGDDAFTSPTLAEPVAVRPLLAG